MRQEIMHSKCGGLAFFYEDGARAGEPIRREKAIKLNGTRPTESEIMRCGTCGRRLNAWELRPGLKEYDASSDADMAKLYTDGRGD